MRDACNMQQIFFRDFHPYFGRTNPIATEIIHLRRSETEIGQDKQVVKFSSEFLGRDE